MKKPLIDTASIKESIKNFKFDKPTMKKLLPYLLEFLLLAVILIADLLSKKYLIQFLSSQENYPYAIKNGLTYSWYDGQMNFTVIPGFLDLTYSLNSGAGFGMFKDDTTALTVVTAVVIVAVLVYLMVFHTDSEWLRIPLVMISAGGIGNLVDRIALGEVRDFFEFTFIDFAIFNVADAFVTVGAIWLIIYLIVEIFKPHKKDEEKDGKSNDEKSSFSIEEVKDDDNAVETDDLKNNGLDDGNAQNISTENASDDILDDNVDDLSTDDDTLNSNDIQEDK